MLKNLVKLANKLDATGQYNIATSIDHIIKIALSLEQALEQYPNDKGIIETLYDHDNTSNKALFNFVLKAKIANKIDNLQQFLDVMHAFQDNEFKNKLKKGISNRISNYIMQ